MQASLAYGRQMTSRQILDTHGREARARGTTNLYPANTRHGEFVGQRFRGYGLVVGRGEKSIFELPTQVLSGKCPIGMTYYPKEAS